MISNCGQIIDLILRGAIPADRQAALEPVLAVCGDRAHQNKFYFEIRFEHL